MNGTSSMPQSFAVICQIRNLNFVSGTTDFFINFHDFPNKSLTHELNSVLLVVAVVVRMNRCYQNRAHAKHEF